MLSIFQNAGNYNSNNTKYQFWRQDNKPIHLFSNGVFDQKIDYIHNNPMAAGFVEVPEHYLYSSSIDYCEKKGLVNIEPIF